MITKALNILKNSNQQFTNLMIYGIGQGFNLVIPLLVVPYIVSICGVENYGKISIGMAISFFFMVFIDYGSDIIGVKEIAVNRENQNELEKIFITTFATKLMLLCIVLTVCSILFFTVPFFSAEKELFFLGLPILIGQFLNPTWFLQGMENFKWITILTVISKLIYLFGVFVFLKQQQDYVFINLWWGIGTIVAHGITLFYTIKKHSFSFRKIRSEAILELIKENFSMFSSQIFLSLQMYSPIMLIGLFGNNLMAGQYKIVEQVIVIFRTYINLFFNFVYPRICYLLEKSIQQGLHFWKIYNGLNFIFITVSMLIIYLFAPELVSYFSKVDIAEISSLLKFAVLIPLSLSISNPLKQLILGLNNQRLYVKFTMIITTVNLLMIVALLQFYEIDGVIFSLILTELITVLVYYISLKDRIRFFQFQKV